MNLLLSSNGTSSKAIRIKASSNTVQDGNGTKELWLDIQDLLSRPRINFIIVLLAALMRTYPKCAKKDSQVINVFLHFRDLWM
jgi:hypothetical protein